MHFPNQDFPLLRDRNHAFVHGSFTSLVREMLGRDNGGICLPFQGIDKRHCPRLHKAFSAQAQDQVLPT